MINDGFLFRNERVKAGLTQREICKCAKKFCKNGKFSEATLIAFERGRNVWMDKQVAANKALEELSSKN